MKNSSTLPASVILSAIILATSIIYHANALSGKSLSLSNFKTGPTADVNPVEPTAPTPDENGAPQVVTVSLDDDPVLGNADAPVTLVEFSDYECPFCKRHADTTLPEIIKNYVDSGKVKIVFRDLPLSFHEPMASKAANAANCVREQKGDSAYYTFHDLWFTNTAANGQGVSDEKMNEYAKQTGADIASFTKCVTDGKYNEEIKADLADATKYGASATPSFFVGKSGDKEIEGEMIIGAQPYSSFQAAFDMYLQ